MTVTIAANPYVWPYDGDIPTGRTALINIDWQVDFCGEGGYVDTMGYDLSLVRTPLGPAQEVLAAARAAGLFIVDRKSTRQNSSHNTLSRMPSSA